MRDGVLSRVLSESNNLPSVYHSQAGLDKMEDSMLRTRNIKSLDLYEIRGLFRRRERAFDRLYG